MNNEQEIRAKHNELCDVVGSVLNMVECLKTEQWNGYAIAWNDAHYGINKARLPKAQEAQDEGLREVRDEADGGDVASVGSVGIGVAGGDSGDSVDALMALIQESIEEDERITIDEAVRPIIAKLVADVKKWRILWNDTAVDRDFTLGALDTQFKRAEKAEAELQAIDLVVSGVCEPLEADKELHGAAYLNACEIRKERDALKAERDEALGEASKWETASMCEEGRREKAETQVTAMKECVEVLRSWHSMEWSEEAFDALAKLKEVQP